MGTKKKSRKRSGRNGGDLAAIIRSYVQQHPDAQYQEVLDGLHAQGYRINRHGSRQLYGLWEDARREAAK